MQVLTEMSCNESLCDESLPRNAPVPSSIAEVACAKPLVPEVSLVFEKPHGAKLNIRSGKEATTIATAHGQDHVISVPGSSDCARKGIHSQKSSHREDKQISSLPFKTYSSFRKGTGNLVYLNGDLSRKQVRFRNCDSPLENEERANEMASSNQSPRQAVTIFGKVRATSSKNEPYFFGSPPVTFSSPISTVSIAREDFTPEETTQPAQIYRSPSKREFVERRNPQPELRDEIPIVQKMFQQLELRLSSIQSQLNILHDEVRTLRETRSACDVQNRVHQAVQCDLGALQELPPAINDISSPVTIDSRKPKPVVTCELQYTSKIPQGNALFELPARGGGAGSAEDKQDLLELLPAPCSDRSVAMNVLAAKYVPEKVTEFSFYDKRTQRRDALISPNDLSLSSFKYLEKYGFIRKQNGNKPQQAAQINENKFLDITTIKNQPKLI